MIEIQPAGIDDVPLLIGLIRELADYENLSSEVLVTEQIMTESLFGSRRTAEALILRHESHLAGYCLFFHNFSTFLGRPGIYVEDLYIRPDFRRRGIGRALFAYLGGLAKERRCARLEFAVLDWNEPAIRFYEGLGAQSLPEWKIYRFTGDGLDRLADLE